MGRLVFVWDNSAVCAEVKRERGLGFRPNGKKGERDETDDKGPNRLRQLAILLFENRLANAGFR